jgi:hypothetical protein
LKAIIGLLKQAQQLKKKVVMVRNVWKN